MKAEDLAKVIHTHYEVLHSGENAVPWWEAPKKDREQTIVTAQKIIKKMVEPIEESLEKLSSAKTVLEEALSLQAPFINNLEFTLWLFGGLFLR